MRPPDQLCPSAHIRIAFIAPEDPPQAPERRPAAARPFAVLFRPLAAQSPTINNEGVLNAAGYTQPVAPGSLASVFGLFDSAGVFVSNGSASTLPLPFSLNGLSFAAAGVPAPVLFVFPYPSQHPSPVGS